MTGSVTCPITQLRWKVAEHSHDALTPGTGRIASLDISLNNIRCSGKYLAFQLAWARQRFSQVEIALGDTLQRHNYCSLGQANKGVLALQEAELASRQEGDDWLGANAKTIAENWSAPYRVRRWDEWREHPEFHLAVKRARDLLTGPTVKPILSGDAVKFAARRGFKEEDVPKAVVTALEEFVIEEIGVYFLHSRDWSVVHLYAGRPLETLHYLDCGGEVPESADEEFLRVMHSRMFVYFEIHEREKARAGM